MYKENENSYVEIRHDYLQSCSRSQLPDLWATLPLDNSHRNINKIYLIKI